MNDEQILDAAMKLVGSAAWRLNLRQFCQRVGEPPDAYWQDKFLQFRELATAMGQFDARTLAAICAEEAVR